MSSYVKTVQGWTQSVYERWLRKYDEEIALGGELGKNAKREKRRMMIARKRGYDYNACVKGV